MDGCRALGHPVPDYATAGRRDFLRLQFLILIYAWNGILFALLILTQPERQTLPVGIALFQGEFTMPWEGPASVVATLPLIGVVLLLPTMDCERAIRRGQ